MCCCLSVSRTDCAICRRVSPCGSGPCEGRSSKVNAICCERAKGASASEAKRSAERRCKGGSLVEDQRLRRPSRLRKKLAKQNSVPSMRQSRAGNVGGILPTGAGEP